MSTQHLGRGQSKAGFHCPGVPKSWRRMLALRGRGGGNAHPGSKQLWLQNWGQPPFLSRDLPLSQGGASCTHVPGQELLVS